MMMTTTFSWNQDVMQDRQYYFMHSNQDHHSIIIPVFNGEKYLHACLQSVENQDFTGKLQVSIFNDASKDSSKDIIEKWKKILKKKNIDVVLTESKAESPMGVGYAKNAAVAASSGKYLCFLDADDVMDKSRVAKQYLAAVGNPNSLIGCQFHREPAESTDRYTRWANSQGANTLLTQIYTSHGPTIIMPTWFCARQVFDNVGKFNEWGKGTPEDLIFFYKHLDLGGGLIKLPEDLLMYRYHSEATTFSIHRKTIWNIRMQHIQENVISKWTSFTIWNAGKQGKQFYRSLIEENRKKVAAFCDVDERKIQHGYYIHMEAPDKKKPRVPIVHFKEAQKPFILCVKLDLTNGNFEENLASLNLTEGIDYYHFS